MYRYGATVGIVLRASSWASFVFVLFRAFTLNPVCNDDCTRMCTAPATLGTGEKCEECPFIFVCSRSKPTACAGTSLALLLVHSCCQVPRFTTLAVVHVYHFTKLIDFHDPLLITFAHAHNPPLTTVMIIRLQHLLMFMILR